ncbi:hypothetical protein PspR76_27565 [Pseudomonas sp. R76]|nr:hypothetical protein PspR76_27565 [Pseudomonas sp. R76]
MFVQRPVVSINPIALFVNSVAVLIDKFFFLINEPPFPIDQATLWVNWAVPVIFSDPLSINALVILIDLMTLLVYRMTVNVYPLI